MLLIGSDEKTCHITKRINVPTTLNNFTMSYAPFFVFGKFGLLKIRKKDINFFRILPIRAMSIVLSVLVLVRVILLFFDCLINSNNKRDFLKKFDINVKKDNKLFNLGVIGNLSVLNNKINFKDISLNNYKASNEDLKFFKDKFEDIFFEENFINIFNLKKIKKFILEIS